MTVPEAEAILEQLFQAQEALERYCLASQEQARQIKALRQSLDAVAAQWPELGAAVRVEVQAEDHQARFSIEGLWLAGQSWPSIEGKLLDCSGSPGLAFCPADLNLPAPFPSCFAAAASPDQAYWQVMPSSKASAGQPGNLPADPAEWRRLRLLARYLAQSLANPAPVVSFKGNGRARWQALAEQLAIDLEVGEILARLGKPAPSIGALNPTAAQDMGEEVTGEGWYAPEFLPEGYGYRWMGETAQVALEVAPNGPLWLRVEGVHAMRPGSLDGLRVSANSRLLAGTIEAAPNHAWTYEALVPATHLREDGHLLLSFASSQAVAEGEDPRRLSLSVKRIALKPWTEAIPPADSAPPPALPRSGPLPAQAEQDMGQALVGSGWHDAEFSPEGFGYRWMGRSARLLLEIAPGPLELDVTGVWAMHPDTLQGLRVSVNGQPLAGELRTEAGLVWHYRARVPASMLDRSGQVALDFEAAATLAPSEADPASGDHRQLSVSVRRVALAPPTP
jgi:hypothetical protein